MTSAGTTTLQPLIEAWLPSQRWFSGKGRGGIVAAQRLAVLREAPAPVEIWVADVSYDDGTTERYQLPLVLRDEPDGTLEHVLLGTVESASAPVWVYDALHDKDATGVWLVGMREESERPPLRFDRFTAPERLAITEASLVLTGEQSNTSVMFADEVIMKVYRRLQPGMNPDIEIHQALGAQGAKHIAALLGSLSYLDDEDRVWSLAMAQEFMTTATDGWEIAKASVRDLFSERDLHADEAGGDFAAEATRLGVAIAEVHADLVAAFGVSEAGRDAVIARAEAMRGRFEHALHVVEQLEEFRDGIRATYDEFEQNTDGLSLQRIHGDLHLGQVLRTSNRWVVIDFEGEPMADLAARARPDTVLRDLAGMLRSFDYAGHHRLVEEPDNSQLAYRAAEWSQRNRDAFCTGYQSVAGVDPRANAAALRAFETDKAIYETVYEARNRPNWLPIPLVSLMRLASSEQFL